jgi:hypothetical protein
MFAGHILQLTAGRDGLPTVSNGGGEHIPTMIQVDLPFIPGYQGEERHFYGVEGIGLIEEKTG